LHSASTRRLETRLELLILVPMRVVSSPFLPVRELRAARECAAQRALQRDFPAHLDLREHVETSPETCTSNAEAFPPCCCERSKLASAPSASCVLRAFLLPNTGCVRSNRPAEAGARRVCVGGGSATRTASVTVGGRCETILFSYIYFWDRRPHQGGSNGQL